MRSAAVLALLLCAGQAVALPVASLMSKGDTEVMECIVEVITDTLSQPSPMPISHQCFETLRGDERILSILRHQNLLKELQDLALQGAKERAHPQKQHVGFQNELSEVLESQGDKTEPEEALREAPSKDEVEKRGPKEAENHGAPPPAPRQESEMENQQAPEEEEEEEEEAANTHPPVNPPGQNPPGSQADGTPESPSQDRAKIQDAGHQAKVEEEEEVAEAGEKADSQEEGPTSALNPDSSPSSKETPRGMTPDGAMERAGKPEAEQAQPSQGKGQQEDSPEEEQIAGTPEGLPRAGKSGEQEGLRSSEWEEAEQEEAKRWSKMDQLAKELTAEKRLVGEDSADSDPDRSMKQLSFRTRTYGFRGPGPQLRRGWRPASEEDSVEAGLPLPGRGYPEEKKEEEGSANRRPEDQELESLSAIEAELDKVAHQLQALRRG
ncbi:chromogranin-A [Echinops telfairi]|uniref:Chromogranin-A n=1 Tax=Echinops telfairi TaxID=9371 RepID=A0AC55CWU4_ECHTE|nr:chromogranin-A [Echinops telfairi]